MELFFRVCFLLYFLKLSAGNGLQYSIYDVTGDDQCQSIVCGMVCVLHLREDVLYVKYVIIDI